MAFDHGELNIPLAKRQGNIDAKIARYLASQRRADAAKAKAGRSLVRQAREAVRALTDEQLRSLAAKTGQTPKAAREQLLSMSWGSAPLILKFATEAAQ